MLFRSEDKLEYEFLPDAIEIEQTPPAPLGRWLIWLVAILFTICIIWSVIGKVDVVATARGKVIPDGRTKVLQPMEESSIKGIFVKEGEKVKEGQLLVEFDSTVSGADVEGMKKELLIANVEKDMLNAELTGATFKENDTKYDFPTANEIINMQQKLRQARELEFQSNLQAAKLVVSQRRKLLTNEKSALQSLMKDFKLEEIKQNDMLNLQESSSTDYLDKEIKLYKSSKNIDDQKNKIKQAEDAVKEAEQIVASIEEKRNHDLLDILVTTEKNITSLTAELKKAEKRLELQQLHSPVDGTIHGISSLTIGGVVSPSQPFISVVPENTPLIVEATISNQDIGFIKMNQMVFLKVDTFPFQKFGYLYGEIIFVSPDAFEDEKSGLIYKAKVKLNTNQSSRGYTMQLSPGMSLTAEVKTDQRRIIEFFLSPIIKYTEESFKLR